MFKDEMARKARIARQEELTAETNKNQTATRNTPSYVTHVSNQILKFYLKRKSRELSSSTVRVHCTSDGVTSFFQYFNSFRREYVHTEGGWHGGLYDEKLFCTELTKILNENGLTATVCGDYDNKVYVSYKI